MWSSTTATGRCETCAPRTLPPRARLIVGDKPLSMTQGIGEAGDGEFDGAAFIGYHAGAGNATGVIAHTYSSATMLELRVNGVPHNEAGVNAIRLGHHGVPVILVAGDDALADEVAALLPWAERVVVKRALGYSAAESLSPDGGARRDPRGDGPRDGPAGRDASVPAGRRRCAARSTSGCRSWPTTRPCFPASSASARGRSGFGAGRRRPVPAASCRSTAWPPCRPPEAADRWTRRSEARCADTDGPVRHRRDRRRRAARTAAGRDDGQRHRQHQRRPAAPDGQHRAAGRDARRHRRLARLRGERPGR